MKRAVGIVVVAALIAAGAWWWLRAQAPEGPRPYLGYVEAETLLVAPEQTGRIVALPVAEGGEVAAGALLFALDDQTATAARAEAQARTARARADLADLRAAQQRPAQIDVLQATRRRAEAALELSRAELARQEALYRQKVIAEARLDQARTAFKRDQSALAEAERAIDAARLPGRESQIVAAEAAVEAAEQARRQAEVMLAQRRVTAPASGRVLDLLYRVGEVAAAGQPVVELLPPANLKLRFYVPEPQVAVLRHGQQVGVACDGCPEGLTATIDFIAPESEYTPPVIFSRAERAKLVFRIEARPTVPTPALKPGLPIEIRP
jgi:HlyD family secretion protein